MPLIGMGKLHRGRQPRCQPQRQCGRISVIFDIIDEETELSDIVFFINLTFSNPNNLKETLKDIIDIHNIEVNEFEKAFEIFENFIKIFREIK